MTMMGYNFKKPTPLRKGKGMLIFSDGLTQEEMEDQRADAKIDHVVVTFHGYW